MRDFITVYLQGVSWPICPSVVGWDQKNSVDYFSLIFGAESSNA